MNPGEFDEKVKILTLSQANDIYQWNATAAVWTKAEPLDENRLFLNHRSRTKSVKFTMRKCSLSLHNAILWNNKYCILTDINEVDRMYYEVTAIMLEPKTCITTKISVSLNPLNRPVASIVSKLTFPGSLIQTYSKNKQGKSMLQIEIHYILIVPKAIELGVGETVEIENITYEVWAPHFISDYNNEYEIRVRSDA